jgi:Protein of unknown function (DUF2807).
MKLTKSIVKAFIFCSIVVVLSSFTMRCSIGESIKGNGDIVKKTIEVKGFNSLLINDAITLQIIQSQNAKVIVQADNNLVNYIDVKVDNNGKLVIKRKDAKKSICFTKLKVYVYAPKLSSIEVNDACSVNIDDFNVGNLQLKIGDASIFKGKLECESLKLKIVGASNVKLLGKAKNCNIDLEDASFLDTQDMIANNATIKLDDASNAKINVLDALSFEVIEASYLSYKGNPKINKRYIDDVSTVQRFD